jgi:hypothetical protein
MKKLILIVVFCATAISYAQGARDDAQKFTAAERASLHTKKMTLALALDNAQSKKVYAVVLSQVEDRMAAQAAKKEQKEGQKPSKEERLKRLNARLDSQIAHQNEMKSILTGPQFEQWKTMAKKGKRGRKGRHHGPQDGRKMHRKN